MIIIIIIIIKRRRRPPSATCKHGWRKHGSGIIVKFKHGLHESCGIEWFEGIMLEPSLLQPCFHVAGGGLRRRFIIIMITIIILLFIIIYYY